MAPNPSLLLALFLLAAGCSSPEDTGEPLATGPWDGYSLPSSDAPPPLSEAEDLRFFQTALAMVARELVLAGRGSSGVVKSETEQVLVSGRWDTSYPDTFPFVFPNNTYHGLASARINHEFRADFLNARLNLHHLTGRFDSEERLLLTLNATFGDDVTQPQSMDIDFWVQASYHLRLAFVDGQSGRTAHYAVDHDGVHSFPSIPLRMEEIPRVTEVVTGSAFDLIRVTVSNGRGVLLRSFTIPMGELLRTCLNIVP